jgi:hypothetical protein
VTVAEGAGTALIANNMFESVAEGAIIGYRWKAPVTAELGRGGGQGFKHLTIEGNRIT